MKPPRALPDSRLPRRPVPAPCPPPRCGRRGSAPLSPGRSAAGAHSTVMPSFFGKSFTEAVELLTGEKGAAQPPDRPSPASFSDFRLPPRSPDNRTARNYLTAARRIDEDVSGFFFSTGDIYEEAAHHNAVFVGRDEDGVPRYAHHSGLQKGNYREIKGLSAVFARVKRKYITDGTVNRCRAVPFYHAFLQTALEIITILCYTNHNRTVGSYKGAKQYENN